MGNKITSIPFRGTPEQEAELMQFINENKQEKGCLMPIMQKAQGIYGYLPIEIQSLIARELGIPMEKVYGVATFYAQFTLVPKGEYNISVCLGTACYVKRAAEVLDRIKMNLNIGDGECTTDGLFSLDATRCLGCCGLAPVMTVNEDVYGKIDPTDVDKILDKYRKM